ncbi:MAG TPA: protein translocase subunit SecF, partial [Verrucomicrobiae bacterium]|nr:protein translocase subunit SecF [Verrucomicrobiae bacterium]
MEFFHGVNVDWMGKAKYFVALSLLLLAVGWISILHSGGIRYGIDFRGGTLVYVRFSGSPPIDKIRTGLQNAGLGNSTIQQISDISNAASKNDVVIGLEQRGQGDESLDAGKQAILDVLHKTFGTDPGGKPDFNSITPSSLAAFLSQNDPLSLRTSAGDRYNQLAQRLIDTRDRDHGGIVTNFDELKNVDGATPAVLNSLRNGSSLGNFTIRNVDIVGPKVGGQLRRQAILATLYALGGMLVYIA